MPIKTTDWDVTEHLDNPEIIAAYISEALETGDPDFIKIALGDVARAKGMTQFSKETGVTREALYRALSDKGDPRMSTLMSVLNALGLRLTATSI